MASEQVKMPDQILQDAIKRAKARPKLRLMKGLYPRISEPLRAAVPPVYDRLDYEESVRAFSAGLKAMAQHWESDVDDWREGWVDNHQLLRRMLARCYRALLDALHEAGQLDADLPETLEGLNERIAQHREGRHCWRHLRHQALGSDEKQDDAQKAGG